MALIIKDKILDTKCWACGQKIDNGEAVILAIGAIGTAYMHPGCAKSISRKLLNDFVELTDLGYINEEDE